MHDARCLENMLFFKCIVCIASKYFYTNHFMYNIIKENMQHIYIYMIKLVLDSQET